MIARKQVCLLLLLGTIGLCGLVLGELLSVSPFHGLISSAEAVVGRPLTPVSVAGVARRTARRCAAGVYDCGVVHRNARRGLVGSSRIRSKGRWIPSGIAGCCV